MSKRIRIETQKEFDALPKSFKEYTYIEIYAKERIIVNIARGNSSVVARENSSVEARENSSVEARENSSVEARGNSSVEAWENSSVEAWGNSSVEAWGNSSVVAWGNSSVVAWGNSSVVARGNSSVVAWGRTSIQIFSPDAVILLFSFAVAIVSKYLKHKIKKKSKNAYIQIVKDLDWFENNAIKKTKNIILYKRVSKEFKTQEDTNNETLWKIGTVVTHKNWNPMQGECGEGKFHAVSRPYFADEFRNKRDDRYIAIKIALKNLYEWKNPQYPNKIAFKCGKVIAEVNKFGKKI
jgi:hypothetical protein